MSAISRLIGRAIKIIKNQGDEIDPSVVRKIHAKMKGGDPENLETIVRDIQATGKPQKADKPDSPSFVQRIQENIDPRYRAAAKLKKEADKMETKEIESSDSLLEKQSAAKQRTEEPEEATIIQATTDENLMKSLIEALRK